MLARRLVAGASHLVADDSFQQYNTISIAPVDLQLRGSELRSAYTPGVRSDQYTCRERELT